MYFYKQVAPTGATVFSCTAPSYQNFSCMNVTYVTTLKISCKLTTSRMLHLAVFLFNGVFALKFPCCQQAAVISCCRHNCLLCQLSISHPQSTKQQNSTPPIWVEGKPLHPRQWGTATPCVYDFSTSHILPFCFSISRNTRKDTKIDMGKKGNIFLLFAIFACFAGYTSF